MIPCKVCGADANLHGVADLNKSCEASRGLFLPLAGVPVWYHRCPDCGFLFTAHFDAWAPEDWRREVYNDGYDLVDPDGADGTRAAANAPTVRAVADALQAGSVLDYGGGDGSLSRRLPPLDAISFDPLRGDRRPDRAFPLVTAFEVFEHTTTPRETARDALSFVAPRGAFLFSTLTCDGLAEQAMDFWYIAPRNGHVSIHTIRSLDLLFAGPGCSIEHLSPALHIARRPQ